MNAVVTPVAVETLLLKRKRTVPTEEVVEATDGLDLDTKGGGELVLFVFKRSQAAAHKPFILFVSKSRIFMKSKLADLVKFTSSKLNDIHELHCFDVF